MTEGAIDACLIAGVESYLEPETLEWLDEHDRLHGAGPLNNAWGFVPGEGAGCVVVASEDAVARCHLEPLAEILAVGQGFEQNRIDTETVCVGEGLTAAFSEALTALPSSEQITDVFCDMNGDPYRADEFGFASLRTRDRFVSASDFIAPADCWGDVSAAAAPLGLMLAVIAARKHYSRGRHALLFASSDGGERGAAVLETAATATR
jgi:3-oxoacyl-[acyl-carrier-protein] synthase-1